MARLARFHWLLLLIAAGIAAICWSFPTSTREIGLDFWNYAEAQREVEQCERDLAAKTAYGRQVSQRLNLKILVVRDLIDRRLTLPEATLRFRDMNQTDSDLDHATLRLFPAEHPNLSHALQVLAFARCQLDHEQPEGDDRFDQLQLEYCEMQAQPAAELE